MRRLTFAAAMTAALALGACSNDGATEPEQVAALEDDYAYVIFGQAGMALQNSLGPQGGRPFDGRTAGLRRLPEGLALTDEQRAEIEALRAAFQAAHADELAELRALFEQAREARSEGATREEIRAILEEGREIHEALHAAVQALHEAVLDVLTDEQRAWLDANRPPPPGERPARGHRRPPGR